MQVPQPTKNKAAINWLKSRSRSARPWLLLSMGIGLLSGIILVAQAHLLSRIVHGAFIQGLTRQQMNPLFVLLIVVFLVKAVMRWCREQVGFQAGAAVRSQVRNDLMAHLVAAGPVGVSHLPAGRLISSVLEQVEGLHHFVALYLPQLALSALLPMVMLAFIFPVSWAAGVLLLCTAPLIPLFMILVGMGAESISQKHFQALARMSAHFLDVLRGLATLKLFGRSKSQGERIAEISRQYRQRTMAVLRVAFLSSAVLEFFSAIAIALVAVYLGMYYLGYIEFGAYGRPLPFAAGFFILLLAPDFFLPLRELGTHYHARADAVGAAEEILKIYEQTPPAALYTGRGQAVTAVAPIRFEGVCVDYGPSRKEGLDGVDLTIERGERIALVGASGVGKSTLIHLLLGFIAPSSGTVTVNGLTLNRMDMAQWRRQCAWIGQQPMLFDGSLKENIVLARPQAGEDQVKAAARQAGVMEFAQRMEAGLDTRVGEQGAGLSVGQAQRVALARAFIKDAPLLLLDEPTASLDKPTESGILADLDAWCQDRTLIMATHRPAALALADRVIVLRQGRIAAQGTYTEMKKDQAHWLPKG